MTPAKKLELLFENENKDQDEDERETLRPPMPSQSGLITLTIQDVLGKVQQNVNPDTDILYRNNYRAFLITIFKGINQCFLKPALFAIIKNNPTKDFKEAALIYLDNYESDFYENCICLSTLNDFKNVISTGDWTTKNGIYNLCKSLKILAENSKNYVVMLPHGELIEFNEKTRKSSS